MSDRDFASAEDVRQLREQCFIGPESLDHRLRVMETAQRETKIKLGWMRITENAIGTAITGGIGLLIYLGAHGWHLF